MTRALRIPRPRLVATLATSIALVALAACGGDESKDQTPNDADTVAGTTESDVGGLVDRFMKARQAGLPVDELLSARAATQYEEHETGLWLHDDSLPGGPGGEYERFSIMESGAEGPARRVMVHIRVVWAGDADPSEFVEGLTVGDGKILDARRTDDASDDGLPLAVAETREQIYRTAVARDYKTLRSLLDPETFSYSFGESGDPIAYWREQEEAEVPVLGDILPGVLHTRFGQTEDVFMWPSAAAKEPSEWTEDDLEGMRQAGSTDEDIRTYEQYGGYTGWRAGIRADGTWLFFVAGD